MGWVKTEQGQPPRPPASLSPSVGRQPHPAPWASDGGSQGRDCPREAQQWDSNASGCDEWVAGETQCTHKFPEGQKLALSIHWVRPMSGDRQQRLAQGKGQVVEGAQCCQPELPEPQWGWNCVLEARDGAASLPTPHQAGQRPRPGLSQERTPGPQSLGWDLPLPSSPSSSSGLSPPALKCCPRAGRPLGATQLRHTDSRTSLGLSRLQSPSLPHNPSIRWHLEFPGYGLGSSPAWGVLNLWEGQGPS